MANISLIDYLFSLYINIDVNDWQNKFEVHISKYLAKMAINWTRTLIGHNSVIFHLILKYARFFEDKSKNGPK